MVKQTMRNDTEKQNYKTSKLKNIKMVKTIENDKDNDKMI